MDEKDAAACIRAMTEADMAEVMASLRQQQRHRVKAKALRACIASGQALVAATSAGGLLAWLEARPDPPSSAGRSLRIELGSYVGVEGPDAARSLLEAFEEHARPKGTSTLRARVTENESEWIEAFERQGFVEHHRLGRYVLDVRRGSVEAASPEGNWVRIESAPSSALPDETLDALLEVFNSGGPDLPPYYDDAFRPASRARLAEWLKIGHQPSPTVILAWHNDAVVGYSVLQARSHDHTKLRQGITVVHREHRGRGVAQALKARSLRVALEGGGRRIETRVASNNQPMLRVNEKFGFRLKESELRLWKKL